MRSIVPDGCSAIDGDRRSLDVACTLKVLPVNLPLARVQIGIITLKNRTLSPVAQLLSSTPARSPKPLAKTKS